MSNFAFGRGSLPDHIVTPEVIYIAEMGLRHWRDDCAAKAVEFVEGVVDVMNGKVSERTFIQSLPCGLNDMRWVEVIYRTCMFATMNVEQDIFRDASVFPFMKVESTICIRRRHPIIGFTAKSDDRIWNIVQPPFAWLCNCKLVPVFFEDARSIPALKRPRMHDLHAIENWMRVSPESAFPLL